MSAKVKAEVCQVDDAVCVCVSIGEVVGGLWVCTVEGSALRQNVKQA